MDVLAGQFNKRPAVGQFLSAQAAARCLADPR
jgi:hypothetical protein